MSQQKATFCDPERLSWDNRVTPYHMMTVYLYVSNWLCARWVQGSRLAHQGSHAYQALSVQGDRNANVNQDLWVIQLFRQTVVFQYYEAASLLTGIDHHGNSLTNSPIRSRNMQRYYFYWILMETQEFTMKCQIIESDRYFYQLNCFAHCSSRQHNETLW